MRLRGEKDVQKARFERLREQNELIVREMAGLKVKFGQSMQLLRKYQVLAASSYPVPCGVMSWSHLISHSFAYRYIAATSIYHAHVLAVIP